MGRSSKYASLFLLAYVFTTLFAWAAVVYIDDFEVGPFSLTVNSGKASDSISAGGLPHDRVVGGQRDAYLRYLGGPSDTVANNTDMPGSLYYGSSPAASAWLRLQYGLAGAMNTDLTHGGVNDGIYLKYAYSDYGPTATCIVTVVSSAGTYSLAKPTISGLGMDGELMAYPFTEFVGVDWTDVDYITIIWTNIPQNNDFTVSFLAAAKYEDFLIPEPGTIVFIGLGCLIAAHRRIRFTWGVPQETLPADATSASA